MMRTNSLVLLLMLAACKSEQRATPLTFGAKKSAQGWKNGDGWAREAPGPFTFSLPGGREWRAEAKSAVLLLDEPPHELTKNRKGYEHTLRLAELNFGSFAELDEAKLYVRRQLAELGEVEGCVDTAASLYKVGGNWEVRVTLSVPPAFSAVYDDCPETTGLGGPLREVTIKPGEALDQGITGPLAVTVELPGGKRWQTLSASVAVTGKGSTHVSLGRFASAEAVISETVRVLTELGVSAGELKTWREGAREKLAQHTDWYPSFVVDGVTVNAVLLGRQQPSWTLGIEFGASTQ